MKKNIILIILFSLILPFGAHAQVVRNVQEASVNNKAVKVGKQQLERDLVELAAFNGKVGRLEVAYRNTNLSEVQALKVELVSDMTREIGQSEQKLTQARREVSQSQSEKRSSNREIRRSRRDVGNGDGDLGERRDLRDDRRDRRDDQRDVRDDKMDLDKRKILLTRQQQIMSTLNAFSFSMEASAQEKALANIKLMNEFAGIMEQDIAATRIELAEDKAEQREDGRERREDRRERREGRRND